MVLYFQTLNMGKKCILWFSVYFRSSTIFNMTFGETIRTAFLYYPSMESQSESMAFTVQSGGRKKLDEADGKK